MHAQLCGQDAIHSMQTCCCLSQQGLKSLMNRLEMALRDAGAQRGMSRSSSRRTSKEPATARQVSRTGSTRRRSMASPSSSLKQSREGFESNLAAERSALPAGLHRSIPVHSVAASPCTTLCDYVSARLLATTAYLLSWACSDTRGTALWNGPTEVCVNHSNDMLYCLYPVKPA